MEILSAEFLVSYDIEDTKQRTKLFNKLKDISLLPIQKSVFWGYLSKAELDFIKRFMKDKLDSKDKVFVTRSNFNRKEKSFYLGHTKEDFSKWKEADVI